MSKLDAITDKFEAIWLDDKAPKGERSKAFRSIVSARGITRPFQLLVDDKNSTPEDRERARKVLEVYNAKADTGKSKDGDSKGQGIDLNKARKDLAKENESLGMSTADRQLAALRARVEHDGKPHVHSYTDAMGNQVVSVRN